MVAEEIVVTLSGGAPWGFRLQGGAEHKKPLQVAKVRRRSKACRAGLREADELLSINDKLCGGLSHAQAMNLIDGGPGTLHIRVKRAPSGFQSVVLLTRSPSPRIDKEYRSAVREVRRGALSSPTGRDGAPRRESVTSPPDSEAYYGETDSDADPAYERQRRQKRRSPSGSPAKLAGRASPEEASEMSGYESAPDGHAYPGPSPPQHSSPPGVARREVVYRPPHASENSPEHSSSSTEGHSPGDGPGPSEMDSGFQEPPSLPPLVSPDRAKDALLLPSRGQLVPMVGPVDNPVAEELTVTYMDKAKQAKLHRGESVQEKQVKEARSKCRSIAALLTDAPNPHSKGVLMFKKRRQRAKKYTLTCFGSVEGASSQDGTTEEDEDEEGVFPGSESELDEDGFTSAPESAWDSDYLDILERKTPTAGLGEAESPGLSATSGRGAQLFEQQRKRAEERAAAAESASAEALSMQGPPPTQLHNPALPTMSSIPTMPATHNMAAPPIMPATHNMAAASNMAATPIMPATHNMAAPPIMPATHNMAAPPVMAATSNLSATSVNYSMMNGDCTVVSRASLVMSPPAMNGGGPGPSGSVLNRTAQPFTSGFPGPRAATTPVVFRPNSAKKSPPQPMAPAQATPLPFPPPSSEVKRAVSTTSLYIPPRHAPRNAPPSVFSPPSSVSAAPFSPFAPSPAPATPFPHPPVPAAPLCNPPAQATPFSPPPPQAPSFYPPPAEATPFSPPLPQAAPLSPLAAQATSVYLPPAQATPLCPPPAQTTPISPPSAPPVQATTLSPPSAPPVQATTLSPPSAPPVQATPLSPPAVQATSVYLPTVQTTPFPTPPVQATPFPTPPVQATPFPTPPVQATPFPTPPVQATPFPTPPVQATPFPTPPVQATPFPSPPVQATPFPTPPVQATPFPTPPVQAMALSQPPVQAMPYCPPAAIATSFYPPPAQAAPVSPPSAQAAPVSPPSAQAAPVSPPSAPAAPVFLPPVRATTLTLAPLQVAPSPPPPAPPTTCPTPTPATPFCPSSTPVGPLSPPAFSTPPCQPCAVVAPPPPTPKVSFNPYVTVATTTPSPPIPATPAPPPPLHPVPAQHPVTAGSSAEPLVSREQRIAVPASRTGILQDARRRSSKKPMFNPPEEKKQSSPNPELLSLVQNLDERPRGGAEPGFESGPEEDSLNLGAEACNFMQVHRSRPPPPVAPKPHAAPEGPQIPQMGGKGAELFARRQSRMDRYVVDRAALGAPPVSPGQARLPSPTPSLPTHWKYSPNIRAPPPISYNPLLSPSCPPGAQRGMKASQTAKVAKKTEAPKQPLKPLDVLSRQPYQLNSAMFTYGGSGTPAQADPQAQNITLTAPKQVPVRAARVYNIKRFSTPTPMSAPASLSPTVIAPRSATTLGEPLWRPDLASPPPTPLSPPPAPTGALPELPKIYATPVPHPVPVPAPGPAGGSACAPLQNARQWFTSAPELSPLGSAASGSSLSVRVPRPRFSTSSMGIQANVWRPGSMLY